MRLLPAALLVLALTACGGDERSGPIPLPSESETPSPSQSPSASPSAAAAPQVEGLEVLAEDPSHDHVEGPVEYDRVPPLGGPHNARWLACGVYDAPVPTEFAVHSTEHGAVWFAHDPDLPAADREALARLAATDPEYVLVSPLAGLDSRIVAVTWGAGLEASSGDDPRLAEMVEAYAGGGQGGEPGAPCRTSGLTPAQAQAALGG